MRQGYLLIQTHPDFPDRVRILTADRPSGALFDPAETATTQIRYAALFYDLDVALMHAHEALRRRLIDIDARLYRADPTLAIAAVESIELQHRRVYLDPELAADPALGEAIARRQRRMQRINRIWSWVGIAALLVLLIKLLLGL